jgi:hypothetical protein
MCLRALLITALLSWCWLYVVTDLVDVGVKSHTVVKDVMYLPVSEHFKRNAAILGIRITHIGKSFSSGDLPPGWTVEARPTQYWDHLSRVILDVNGVPRMTLWAKLAVYDEFASYEMLPNE